MKIFRNLPDLYNVIRCEYIMESLFDDLKAMTFEERDKFRNLLKKRRRDLNPINTNEDLAVLYAEYEDTGDIELFKQWVELCKSEMFDDDGVNVWEVSFGKIFEMIAKADKMNEHLRPDKKLTNRYKNAKRQAAKKDDVCTPYSLGQQPPNPRHKDKFGNLIGDQYDYWTDSQVRENGINGVVIQCYWNSRFDFSKPISAARSKGIKLTHFYANRIPSPKALKILLNGANFCIIVSGKNIIGCTSYITPTHGNIILKAWKKGMGLKIDGDNYPHYGEANWFLRKMSEHIGIPPRSVIQMKGNNPASRNVTLSRERHIVLQSLETVYPGFTVADFNGYDDILSEYGFEKGIHDHDGNLISIFLQGSVRHGPMAADGGFTRYYMGWDNVGSARIVKNTMCWLSTEHTGTAKLEAERGVVQELPDFTKGQVFLCSILYDDRIVGFSVKYLPVEIVEETNVKNDYFQDNALQAFSHNRNVVGRLPISHEVIKLLVETGKPDPLTRERITAFLPVFDLSYKPNRDLLKGLANNMFLGGADLGQTSIFMLLGVLNDMLYNEPENRECIVYFQEEIINNFTSTPTFTDVGSQMILAKALGTYFNAQGFPTKDFPMITTMARLVVEYSLCGDDSRMESLRFVRRALIVSIIKKLLYFAKNGARSKKKDLIGKNEDKRIHNLIDRYLYDTVLGVPMRGTGHTINYDSLRFMKSFEETYKREFRKLSDCFDMPEEEIFSSDMITWLLISLRKARNYRLYKIEEFIKNLRTTDEDFETIYNGNMVRKDLGEHLEQRFAKFTPLKPKYNKMLVPFFTCFGPSVCAILDGYNIVEILSNPYEETYKAIHTKRRKFLASEFKTDGRSAMCLPNSSVYPLHRTVQTVLCKNFPDATERTLEMTREVVSRLVHRQLGYIYDELLSDRIDFAIDSYIELRNAGMEEPNMKKTIRMETRVAKERLYWDTFIEKHLGGISPF